MRIIKIIFFIILILSTQISKSKIFINEIMSSNTKTIADEEGDLPDWIELYNPDNSTVKLKGYGLSDSKDNIDKWTFPDIVFPPQSYLLIFASGKDKYSKSEIHTNFKIDVDGEPIIFSDNKGNIIDQILPIKLYSDVSFGRDPDGSNNYFRFITPTPKSSNKGSIQLDTLDFSQEGGYFLTDFHLEINVSNLDAKIYYTTDGSLPDSNSNLYIKPIKIRNRTKDKAIFSLIPTNSEDDPKDFRWKEPQGDIFKGTVIRACSYQNSSRTSIIYTNTYFVDANMYNRYLFPIISFSVDSLDLFGYNKGIYVPGKIHDEYPTQWYWGSGNYFAKGDDWERKLHIEYFERDGKIAFSQDAGVRINGTGGRALPLKSLRLYARSEYGKSNFHNKLFPLRKNDKYKRFILRNSGQDFFWTMFADAFIQNVSVPLGIEFQDFRPVIVFINGEYWGIENMRERYDEYYFDENYKVKDENVQIFDNALLTFPYLSNNFNELCNFIKTHDLSDNFNYQYVSNYLDIENLQNYLTQKIYFGVFDWPGNNIKLWRDSVGNSKWRWISFDNDDGLMYDSLNSFAHITADSSKDWRNPPWSTFIFRNLMKNDEFKLGLFKSLELRMNTIFRSENLLKKIDEFKQLYEPEIEEHIRRWGFPEDLDDWNFYIQRMRNFVTDRKLYLTRFLKDMYNNNLRIYKESDIIGNSIINIYPNPCSENLNFEIISKNKGRLQIFLYDMLGKEVINSVVKDFHIYYNTKINVSTMQGGMYFLIVKFDNEIVSKKIIINH